LPYHIGGVIPDRDSLLLQTPESLGKSLALDVRTGQDVIRIDRSAKEVEVRDLAQGRTYREPYDKLVLCLGAEPVRPPIPGADDPRVDVLRNTPDMDRIIAQLDKDATSAVIVGGSYIGLELTEAFRARGLQTTVVERTERLMPWLDPEMTRILDYHVGTHEVDLRLGTSAQAVRRAEDGGLVIDLSDGTSLEADVVVMAAGARPNVGLARGAGLETGPRGGIVVDAQMRTSAPDILAAGDAVETAHFLTGEPTLSMLAGPGEPGRPDRRRHDRRPRQRLPGYPGHRRGPGVRHDRRWHRPDRDRAARRGHGLPQGLHPPERPCRVLPRDRAAVPEGAVRPGRGEAAGRAGARLGRRRQAHRRSGGRAARRDDGV